MTPATPPPLGDCQLCRHNKHLWPHKSKRDGLVRNLCGSCHESATTAEERGGFINFDQAHTHGSDEDLLTWLRGDL
ncbi:hypothetical protein [Streptomyces prunicolor]|uniref:hypothetical protein n=1 Tax=Streptomyces prunicolor TaxID=67348 RepID=UPI00035CED8F|nr:hypothetical protein [Streptomyces prunicolor]